MTPQGQKVRADLLERLFGMVHLETTGDSGPQLLNTGLFNCDKGQKLLADVLPLWTAQMVFSVLLSFVKQLPTTLREQPAVPPSVRTLAKALANAPKALVPEQCVQLLQGTTAHGADVLQRGLQRSDLTALLLGVLCRGVPEQSLAELTAFYAVLLPLANTREEPWALLNAALPTIAGPHAALLEQATGCAPLPPPSPLPPHPPQAAVPRALAG